MKTLTLIGALLVIWSHPQAYAQHPFAKLQAGRPDVVSATPAQDSQSKIDPEKEAAIRQLLFQTGIEITLNQMLGDMEKNLKPMIISSLPPGEYRDGLVDLWFEKFKSKLGNELFEVAVPVYDRHLSLEEIKGLIQFYGTPLGQKALRLTPLLTGELQEKGEKLGELVGQESMLEVLSEHPDLKKEIEAAEKRSEQPK